MNGSQDAVQNERLRRLELVLLEYVERYGLTPAARAFLEDAGAERQPKSATQGDDETTAPLPVHATAL